jgi:hypothetical protein
MRPIAEALCSYDRGEEAQRNNVSDSGDMMELWAWSRSYDVTTHTIVELWRNNAIYRQGIVQLWSWWGGTTEQCLWFRRYDGTMSMITELWRNNAHYTTTHCIWCSYKKFDYRFIIATKLIYVRSLRDLWTKYEMKSGTQAANNEWKH